MEAAVVLCFANLKTDQIIHSSMWRMVKNVGIEGAITELALQGAAMQDSVIWISAYETMIPASDCTLE